MSRRASGNVNTPGDMYDYGTAYYSNPSAQDTRARLDPLIEVLQKYDRERVALEERGGDVERMAMLTSILTEPVIVNGPHRRHQFSLDQPDELRIMIDHVGYGNFYLQVRQLETGMPSYYLCRLRRDYWSRYKFVVEDLYRSPGYPERDDRFAALMDWGGHEVHYLRLAPFRHATATLVGAHADTPAHRPIAFSKSRCYKRLHVEIGHRPG